HTAPHRGMSSDSPLLRIEEIDDRADFLIGEDQISFERRHHGLRIALALVGDYRDQLGAVGESLLHVIERRPEVAGRVAALDVVTGEAIALAAIERKLLAGR